MPIARVNNIEINYRLEGDGAETIVLVNGLADDLETWVLQMPAGCLPTTRRLWSTSSASPAST